MLAVGLWRFFVRFSQLEDTYREKVQFGHEFDIFCRSSLYPVIPQEFCMGFFINSRLGLFLYWFLIWSLGCSSGFISPSQFWCLCSLFPYHPYAQLPITATCEGNGVKIRRTWHNDSLPFLYFWLLERLLRKGTYSLHPSPYSPSMMTTHCRHVSHKFIVHWTAELSVKQW